MNWWERSAGASERVRVPAPVLRRRIPSGRGATEQPNATGDGDAALTVRFWIAIVATGVGAGLLGVCAMLVLFAVQDAAFPSHIDNFQAAVEHASDLGRVLPLLVVGAVAGPGWYLLRRYTSGQRSEVDDALWSGDGSLSLPRCVGTSLLSEFVIGAGASIGREAAPKLLGGLSGSMVAGWLGLTASQRRLLVACGAGAGLAAVYNVPLGGALFTAEVLVGAVTLPTVLPALACAGIATLTAYVYLPIQPVYSGLPDYHFRATILVLAVLAGPVVGLLAAGWIRLIGWVSYRRVTGRVQLIAPLLAFAALGGLGIEYPELFGNGKTLAHQAFLGTGTITLFLALALLKPLVTALCLESGASGGLLTPSMATGAALGAFGGIAWSHLWPGSPVGAYALIGAAAMLSASMQAPLTGLALMLELTHSGFGLLIPMVAAAVPATAVARWLDGYSIHSARLGARHEETAVAPGDPVGDPG
jgi:chloride channel protein, CIC family